jgi:hypothetical protein
MDPAKRADAGYGLMAGATAANENGLIWCLTDPEAGGEVRLQTVREVFTLGTFEQAKCWLEAHLELADFGSPEPEIRGVRGRLEEDAGRLMFVWTGAGPPATVDLGPADAAAQELAQWLARHDLE